MYRSGEGGKAFDVSDTGSCCMRWIYLLLVIITDWDSNHELSLPILLPVWRAIYQDACIQSVVRIPACSPLWASAVLQRQSSNRLINTWVQSFGVASWARTNVGDLTKAQLLAQVLPGPEKTSLVFGQGIALALPANLCNLGISLARQLSWYAIKTRKRVEYSVPNNQSEMCIKVKDSPAPKSQTAGGIREPLFIIRERVIQSKACLIMKFDGEMMQVPL